MHSERNPLCRNLWLAGELAEKVESAWRELDSCELCAHECGVDRRAGEKGICQADHSVQISDYGPHYGEEDVLVGKHGSGTIFFSGCNLKCVFCQNWDISHLRSGFTVSEQRLASIMIELQKRGCHNINLVTPTHYLPQILSALAIACEDGLNLPLVYNCGGYESMKALRLLDGVIDIYMPDVKFADPKVGLRLARVKDYPGVVKRALKEMHRQVGVLQIGGDGVAYQGLLVRHLVLPQGLAGTKEIVEFIARELSANTYVNIMSQYRPEYKAADYPPLDRPTHYSEYKQALSLARAAGLTRLA